MIFPPFSCCAQHKLTRFCQAKPPISEKPSVSHLTQEVGGLTGPAEISEKFVDLDAPPMLSVREWRPPVDASQQHMKFLMGFLYEDYSSLTITRQSSECDPRRPRQEWGVSQVLCRRSKFTWIGAFV